MANAIQGFPQGLVDLLNIKQGPVVIDEMENNVRGTVELTDVYALPQVGGTSASDAAAVVGSSAQITVPFGEVWVVYNAHAALNMNDPGDVMQCTLNVITDGSSTTIAQSPLQVAVASTDFITASVNFSRPLLLRPDEALRAVVSTAVFAVAGPTQLAVRARLARIGPETKITTV